ncbi:deoxyhypusine synthase [Vigna unguiculata]|uniref:Deoxyhypusine synthase n=1 Tax=Vigna unguiculata TaxID=3917 RepID=A0A4D6LVF6_VIGUN|nr:deoxyhypusine synthase [Vigna unguiculata]
MEETKRKGEEVLASVHSTVFKESESLDGKCAKIEGYDFNRGVNYPLLLRSMATTGFQASNLGDAIQVVNQMLDWRLVDEAVTEDCSDHERDLEYRKCVTCKVFLGFTSNLISSGVRDIVRFLLQHRMVDVVVTTTGGIEEDLIKCLAPTFIGDFSLPGAYLRSKGLNRIGNLLVPNDNYCKFEDWIIPIFDQMLKEQNTENVLWTPSKLIARLGKEINNESSYLYWAYKNNIPVFCPGLTDGSLGDMLYFHSFRNPGLILDVVQEESTLVSPPPTSLAKKHEGRVQAIHGVSFLLHRDIHHVAGRGSSATIGLRLTNDFDRHDHHEHSYGVCVVVVAAICPCLDWTHSVNHNCCAVVG